MPSESKDAAASNFGAETEGEASIVNKVSRYFFDDRDFSFAFPGVSCGRSRGGGGPMIPTPRLTFERWAEDHACEIDFEADEFELKYTELYNEFKHKYESLLEAFIAKQGSSVADFYHELRAATEVDPDGPEALVGQIMLATTDFDIFMQMMRDTRRQQLRKEAVATRHK